MSENSVLCAKYVKITTIELYENHKDTISYLIVLLVFYSSIINMFHSMYVLNTYVIFTIYWLFLGIMATIGLGTGMYTGTFYLFPYILEIKSQAQICNNLNFSILDLECKNNQVEHYNNLQLLIKTMPPVLIWSLGSTLGEIPPYLMAKLTKNDHEKYLNKSILNKLKKNAFTTITMLSVMPNFTFDMCGLASGFLDIPLSTFISAGFLGKGIIKSPLEAYAVLFLLDEQIETYKSNSYLSYGYYTIFYGTMGFFIKKLIDQCAEKYKQRFKQF